MTICYRMLSRLLLLLILVFYKPAFANGEEIEYQTPGGITVTAPAGMEEQARQVGAIADKVLPPYGREYNAFRQAMMKAGLEKRIADLLGCQENMETTRTILAEFDKVMVAPYADCFTHVMIIRDTEVIAPGILTFGSIKVRYDRAENSMNLSFAPYVQITKTMPEANPATEKPLSSVIPVVLAEEDGYAVREEDEAAFLNWVADTLIVSCLLPIHEATEGTLAIHVLSDGANKDKPYFHPYNRWFAEGVANWVMLRLGAEIAPRAAASLQAQYTPPADDPRREYINLPLWSFMMGFDLIPNERTAQQDAYLYPYATELVGRLLAGQPEGTLAKIVRQLKHTKLPNPHEVTQAISDVTGKDAGSIIAQYVPHNVRVRLEDGTRPPLESARAAARAADYTNTAQYLAFAVAIDPGDAALHFHLAWALRKAGADRKESDFELKQALLLSRYTEQRTGRAVEIKPFYLNDAETLYLLGRREQVFDRPEQAKKFYRRALAKAPRHADTLAALEEMKSEDRE